MKKLTFLILTGCFTIAAVAQNNFLLYSFKGNVSVVENKVETKSKEGKPLNSNATIKLTACSSATLICYEADLFSLT